MPVDCVTMSIDKLLEVVAWQSQRVERLFLTIFWNTYLEIQMAKAGI